MFAPDDWRKMQALPKHWWHPCDLGSTGRQQQTDRLLMLLYLPPILTSPVGLGLTSPHLPPLWSLLAPGKQAMLNVKP